MSVEQLPSAGPDPAIRGHQRVGPFVSIDTNLDHCHRPISLSQRARTRRTAGGHASVEDRPGSYQVTPGRSAVPSEQHDKGRSHSLTAGTSEEMSQPAGHPHLDTEAKKPTARFKMSRSSRNVRFSRRNAANSSRSVLDSPGRTPASTSACATQRRTAVSVKSSSADTDAGFRRLAAQLDYLSLELRTERPTTALCHRL